MKNWRIWLILALIVIAGGIAYFFSASVKDTQVYQGTVLNGGASDFGLFDQNGNLVRLSDFGDKIIVLAFMDSQCQDVCPLTSAQLIQTYKNLDPGEVSRVVFLAVNVTVDANTIADVSLATVKWRLEQIPDWHFLTGTVEELESVWRDYAVAVTNDPNSREIMHTSGVYLIAPAGQKRWYISTPYSEDGNTEWTLPLSELLVNHIREILKDN